MTTMALNICETFTYAPGPPQILLEEEERGRMRTKRTMRKMMYPCYEINS